MFLFRLQLTMQCYIVSNIFSHFTYTDIRTQPDATTKCTFFNVREKIYPCKNKLSETNVINMKANIHTHMTNMYIATYNTKTNDSVDCETVDEQQNCQRAKNFFFIF